MQADYLNYIDKLPQASPEVFGLHDNAEITNSQKQHHILARNSAFNPAKEHFRKRQVAREDNRRTGHVYRVENTNWV